MQKSFIILFVLISVLTSCQHREAATEEDEGVSAEEVQTPVTVTSPERSTLSDYVELNATSSFLQNNFIKASANGYIQSVHVKMGEMVHAGEVAFVLKTKEAQALGNTINKLDPSFHFTGIINIRAAAGGYIQELNHQA